MSAPVVKEKVSIIASLRYSPLGLEYKAIEPLISDDIDKPSRLSTSVYDLFAKLSYNISRKHNIYVSAFKSNDKYEYDNEGESEDFMQWRNMMVNGVWNYTPEDKISIRTNIAFNGFESLQKQMKKTHSQAKKSTKMEVSSHIREITASSVAALKQGKWNLQGGISFKYAMFEPGSYKQASLNNGAEGESHAGTSVAFDNGSNTILAGIHAQAEYGRKNKWMTRVAARGNWFNNGSYNRIDPEIRLFATYFFTQAFGVEATADYLTQYYHTLEGIPTGWSLDMIIPSDKVNVPETALQLYAGTFINVGKMKFSVGAFHKEMKNLVYFTKATDFFSSSLSEWKDNIDIGKGTSRGVEFLAEKKGVKLLAKLAYTWSRTDRKYPDIYYGKPIPFKFDRTHVINANATYIIAKDDRKDHGITAAFSLSSGHYETLRSSIYEGFIPGMETSQDPVIQEYVQNRDYFTHPNNYRMPLYLRGDLGYYINIAGKSMNHALNLGIYNITNRHNAYSLFWDEEDRTWKKLSIFPIMPNIHYKLSF